MRPILELQEALEVVEGLMKAVETQWEEVWENKREVRKGLNRLEDKQRELVEGLRKGEEKVLE